MTDIWGEIFDKIILEAVPIMVTQKQYMLIIL